MIAVAHLKMCMVIGAMLRLARMGLPVMAKHINAPHTKNLSASGSAMRPNLLVSSNG